jgi:hypothetical protein
MKVEIKLTDDAGNVELYSANGTLYQLVWDAFLTADCQDEQWEDEDTCKLIIEKLKGKSPIEYANIKH